jgi:hypothetical protein
MLPAPVAVVDAPACPPPGALAADSARPARRCRPRGPTVRKPSVRQGTPPSPCTPHPSLGMCCVLPSAGLDPDFHLSHPLGQLRPRWSRPGRREPGRTRGEHGCLTRVRPGCGARAFRVRVPVADDPAACRRSKGTRRSGAGRGRQRGSGPPVPVSLVPPGQQAPPLAQTLSSVPPRDTTAARQPPSAAICYRPATAARSRSRYRCSSASSVSGRTSASVKSVSTASSWRAISMTASY